MDSGKTDWSLKGQNRIILLSGEMNFDDVAFKCKWNQRWNWNSKWYFTQVVKWKFDHLCTHAFPLKQVTVLTL